MTIRYLEWVTACKEEQKEVMVNRSVAVAGNPMFLSPTNNRTNKHLDDAADDTLTPRGNDPTDFQDMDEQALKNLQKPPEDFETGPLTILRMITWCHRTTLRTSTQKNNGE